MIRKFTLFFLLTVSISIYSQDKTAMERMTQEIQQIKQTTKTLKLVWWIPTEFWKTVMSQQMGSTAEQQNYITNLFDDYTIFVAGDYNLEAINAGLDFTVNDVRKSLTFYENGKKVPLLKESEIDDKVLSLMNDMMKPVFEQMLGKMGSGVDIFIYNNRDSAGKRILNPYNSGNFTVELGKDKFEWKLPLVSLMKEKVCKTDSAKFPGNFVYCPFHGTEL